MHEQSPAFQFYPKDFLADSNVAAMTMAERGAYITLLCLCWMEGSVPGELEALARLCRLSLSGFTRLWPALAPCFTVQAGRLVQGRIERERRKQATWRAMKVEAGHKGGLAKASSARNLTKQTASRRLADASPPFPSPSSDYVQEHQPANQQEPSPMDRVVASLKDKPGGRKFHGRFR